MLFLLYYVKEKMMPKINDYYDEWEDMEDRYHDKNVREKISNKTKTHNKKEWDKIDERLQKNNNVKYVKNKRRKNRKNNNRDYS